jgi:hypothetical protein
VRLARRGDPISEDDVVESHNRTINAFATVFAENLLIGTLLVINCVDPTKKNAIVRRKFFEKKERKKKKKKKEKALLECRLSAMH